MLFKINLPGLDRPCWKGQGHGMCSSGERFRSARPGLGVLMGTTLPGTYLPPP